MFGGNDGEDAAVQSAQESGVGQSLQLRTGTGVCGLSIARRDDAKLSVRERMRASTSSLDSVWAPSPCAMPQKVRTRARVSPCSAKSFQ